MTCPKKPICVTFVCLGNICRSPMAEAVFRHLVDQAGLGDCFEIHSRATSTYEIGEPVHPGTQKVLRRHNIPLDASKRARQITRQEYTASDYVVVMDESNALDLRVYGVAHSLMDFAPDLHASEVPDPYYSGDFDTTYRLVLAGCAGLLAHIRREQRI